jgi:hypothetical protein
MGRYLPGVKKSKLRGAGRLRGVIPAARSIAALAAAFGGLSAAAQNAPTAPPQPAEWTAAEIEAGRQDCRAQLAGLDAVFEPAAPIKDGDCGLPAPIQLKGFKNGREPPLLFQPPPMVSCKLARALGRWIADVVQPAALSHLQAPIVAMTTLSSYNCRARYDNPAKRMSEHAYANAVDIAAFVTAKGERITVEEHWNEDGERSAFLHEVHAGACRMFGTVLGPEANASHKNHFHLDMRARRQPLCDFTPEQIRAREEAGKK